MTPSRRPPSRPRRWTCARRWRACAVGRALPPAFRAATRSRAIIRLALAEDVGRGDITTEATVAAETTATAEILQKQAGVLCGLPVVEAVFATVDPRVRVTRAGRGGLLGRAPRSVARIEGPARVDPDRRADGLELLAAALGRGDGQPPRRRARRRHPHRGARHPQDDARLPGAGEVRRSGWRLPQPPGRPGRRLPDQGEPHPRGRRDHAGRARREATGPRRPSASRSR